MGIVVNSDVSNFYSVAAFSVVCQSADGLR